VLVALLGCGDAEVERDSCWALKYISDSGDAYAQAVVDADAAPKLVAIARFVYTVC
jgi:hypothetical protein